jgi:hypothetical protein
MFCIINNNPIGDNMTIYTEIAKMALRVQKENVKLKQEKKQLQDTLERIKDANRYRYMING